jgi:uncharacterized protein
MFHKVLNLLEHCQLKFDSNDQGTFTGYASVFNSNDAVNDTILPGAFQKSIESGHSVKMFVNHDHHAVPVGDWVTLKEDDHGLAVTGKIDLNHKDGPTVFSAMKRGALDGQSIGFTMEPSDYQKKSTGGRIIRNLTLKEISLVSFPCESQARITAVKAEIMGLESLSDLEHYLREAGGFSKSMASYFVSQCSRIARGEPVESVKQITGMEAKLTSTILEFGQRFK